MGLFVLTQDANAVSAVLKDGKMTIDGKSFTGPSVAANDQLIPSGSTYYLEDIRQDAKQRIIIYAPNEMAVGSQATVVVWEFSAPNNYVSRISSETVTISDVAEEGVEDTSCTAQTGAVGWIVCPTSSFLAKITDYLFGVLEDFLVVKPMYADNESPVYATWQYMRNIANVVFVVFMMIVIISQVTSIGISNYGIKKVLPRIITAILLVNLSYVICALAVDLSNIIGHELREVFVSIQSAITDTGVGTSITIEGSTWAQMLTILTGGAGIATLGLVASGGFMGAIFLLIPVLFGALIAIIAAIITLAARQALVILLVIVSPLALVAYLLPNTDKLFKKWMDLLLKMLVIFPAFSLIFGAAQLAGWVIITSATNVPTVILGMAVQIIPLIFTPMLAKLSGSLLGSINSLVQKPFGAAQKAITNWGAENANIRRREMAAKGLAGEGWGTATLAGGLAKRRAFRADRLKTAEADVDSLSRTAIARRNARRDRNGNMSESAERAYRSKLLSEKANLATESWNHDMSSMSDILDKAQETGRANAVTRRMSRSATEMTRIFEDSELEKKRAQAIAVADADYLNKEFIKAEIAHNRGEYSDMYERVVRAGEARGEEGVRSILASAAAAKDNEDKRILEETTVSLGKSTQNNEFELIREFKNAYKAKDGFGMRAAMNIMVEKKGSYGIGMLEKAVQEMFSGSEEYAAANDDNTINGILANHLANSGIAGDMRKKAAMLWYWGSQHAGKDADGNYAPLDKYGNPKDLKAYNFTDPSVHYDDAVNIVNNVLTGPGDIIKQGAGTIKHFVATGALSSARARQELANAGMDPAGLADYDRDKLISLGLCAGIVTGGRPTDTASEIAAEQIVYEFMNSNRPGGVAPLVPPSTD